MDNDFRNRLRGTDRPVKTVRPLPPRTQPQRPVVTQSAPASPSEPIVPEPPKKSRKLLWLVLGIIILLLIGGGVFAYRKYRDNKTSDAYKLGNGQKAPSAGDGQANESIAPTTVRLVATGDMIAHDSVNANAKKSDGSYDYAALMADMKPYFQKADVRFCNQATPAGGESFGITGYPTFNAPIAFARGIEEVGCNLVNIGTNHTNDKGQPLIDATVAAWDNRENVLAVAGANRSAGEQNKARLFTVNGVKFALLSYSTYSNNRSLTPHGLNMYSDNLATTQIASVKNEADIIIVSMRWGTEYSPDVNTQQNTIAQKLTDLGADVILGHGPHVLEPVKRIKSADGNNDSVVWFSLGNFLNTQIEPEALIGGFAVMDYDITSKKLTNLAFMPTYMHYEWTAAQKAANNLLARKNLVMAPLDKAASLMAKSQIGTTVDAQTKRVRDVLNKFTEVKIITSAEY